VGVGVAVGVEVAVGVGVKVGVGVLVGAGVAVGVFVDVGVFVGETAVSATEIGTAVGVTTLSTFRQPTRPIMTQKTKQ
jgi:hypothetical protein